MNLNKMCEIEDWGNPRVADMMRQVLPYFINIKPEFPRGMEHRKHWEFAILLLGLKDLDAIKPEAFALSVAAGHEEPVYYLTNTLRWVFATDIYGLGDFSRHEADAKMLSNPDHFAHIPYNRNRLVVQYMNALDLRYEPNTFDIVYSLSSIEHFGGTEGAVRSLEEMCRVLKPAGVAAVTTECIVNGKPGLSEPGLELFTPEAISELSKAVRGLELVSPIDFRVSARTLRKVIALPQAIADADRGQTDYPHIVLELKGRQWTSVSMFFRKTASDASAAK